MGRRVIVSLFACLVALAAAGRASAFTRQDLMLHMDDGVDLAATLYRPTQAQQPSPAVVMFHGLGATRQQVDPIAQRFANNFVVLTFDARGHGQSGGFVTVDGPREIADTRAVYDWLAAQPYVDPHAIGAWGISLGGGAVLRSLVDPVPVHWAAAELLDTWNDLYSALAPQNLTKSGAIYALTNGVKLDPSVQAIVGDAIASRNLSVLRAWAAQRSSRASLSRVTIPVYLFQGRRDFVFDLAQAKAAYRLLNGPKELYLGDFGHGPSTFPGPDIDTVVGEGETWFIRWLIHPPIPPVRYPVSISPDPWAGEPHHFKKLPATRSVRIAFPGSTTFAAGGKAQRTSGRLRSLVETFGSARVRVKAKLSGGWARVVAVLTAKPRRGKSIVVSEGGINTAALRGTHTLTIDMIDDATVIPRGATLTLTLASSSLAQDPNNLLYLDPTMPRGAKVSLGPARLTIPVLRRPISR
ncbi:MAG TPA: CocE/NonD family hydrolase [Gaiellaceae bacterium]